MKRHLAMAVMAAHGCLAMVSGAQATDSSVASGFLQTLPQRKSDGEEVSRRR